MNSKCIVSFELTLTEFEFLWDGLDMHGDKWGGKPFKVRMEKIKMYNHLNDLFIKQVNVFRSQIDERKKNI